MQLSLDRVLLLHSHQKVLTIKILENQNAFAFIMDIGKFCVLWYNQQHARAKKLRKGDHAKAGGNNFGTLPPTYLVVLSSGKHMPPSLLVTSVI